MTTPGHRLRLAPPTLLASLAGLGAIGLLLLVAPPPSAARGATAPLGGTPAHAALPSVSADLTLLEPVTVRPGKRLRVGGSLTTDRPLRGVRVQLEVGTTAYGTRIGLAEATQAVSDPSDASTAPATTVPVTDAVQRIGQVARTATFLVRTPTDALPLPATSSGVYPMRLRVTAVVGGVTETVASVDTFLPWAPADLGVSATSVLWFWPLVDQPRRDSAGETSPGLAPQLAPGGRLWTLLDAAADQPVTWAVDPALLADAEAVAQPPRRTTGVTEAASAGAGRWLEQLRSGTAAGTLVGLPYADPDLAAVSAAGRPGVLRDARSHGTLVVGSVLGRAADFTLAWPAQGFADDAVLRTLAGTGFTSVLLSGAAVPLPSPPPWTPSGRVDLADDRLAGLVSDPVLDEVVAQGPADLGGVLLARQVFLAQLLQMTVELPSDPRLAVLAPPRRWDPAPAWADALMSATARASWIRPVPLSEALTREAPLVAREAPQLPERVAEEQIPLLSVETTATTLRDLSRFRAILTDRSPATTYHQAALGALSTAWRGEPEVSLGLAEQTAESLAADRGKVKIVSRDATLSAESAPLPVTVRNQLDQPVRVRLSVSSVDPLRLRATAPDEVLEVDAGGSTSVSVQLDAVTSGRLALDVGLLTPRGRAYAEPTEIWVDVRAYGKVALIVFGLAAGLLVLAAAVRITRRVRRARAGGSTEAPGQGGA